MDQTHTMSDYSQIARESRLKVLDLIYKAQTSHIASNFSAADIMAVLFEKIDLDKDIFVLSAGWKAALLYYHLWRKGRITEEELNSYCQPGSKFVGLAEPVCKDIKIAGGSMGLGLPGAVGLALAKKLKGEEGRVYVLMSDGELQCGTTWESIQIAAQHKLDNLTVLIDENGLQAMGETQNILKTYFPCGGHWDYSYPDGHDFKQLENALREDWVRYPEKPRVITCKTIKGKGVSFMENNNIWHYKSPNEEEYLEAKQELERNN